MATTSAPMTRTSRTATLAAGGIVLAAIVIIAGNYNVSTGESGGLGEGIATAAICAVVAAVLFGLVVPHVRNHDRATLILGALVLLSLAAFWSGVTPILAAATLAVAVPEPSQGRRIAVVRWLSIVATALVVVWTLANSHLF